jgi:hypothetical protein
MGSGDEDQPSIDAVNNHIRTMNNAATKIQRAYLRYTERMSFLVASASQFTPPAYDDHGDNKYNNDDKVDEDGKNNEDD